MSYIDNYTQSEIAQIVQQSTSYKEVARKIGYSTSPSGDTIKKIKERLRNYDTSHFTPATSHKQKRTVENTFIVNSTASQASLRRLYKNGNFTAYECAICHQEPIWQGKELTLILDHINGINNDDRLENLRWVCPNCNQQLETTGSRNLKQKTFVKKYFCQDCGIEISKTSVRCKTCSMKARAIPIEEMRVTREELKDLIRHQSFVSIGKKYQVSDNTIRKWCSKLQLPQKKSDIQKYSDDDWLKL